MKKGNLAFNWVEYLFLTLSIVGLVLALSIHNPAISYFTIFICGLLSGRLTYKLKKNLSLPMVLLFLGFLIGYLIGSYYSSRTAILIIFFVAGFIGYYIHDKGYLEL